MNHVKIGGTFLGGLVAAINNEGIFVLKNGFTRFYTKQEVEKEIAVVRATVQRSVQKLITRRVCEQLLAESGEI